jgi:glycosyltransferase involved in cell wall biosynthesis
VKIAVWNNLPSGGGKRALFQHVRGLLERGHEVESWTLETADRTYLPLAELVPEHVVPFANPVRPASRVVCGVQALAGRTDVTERIARMHAACARSAREMRDRNVDVVFAASCMVFLVPYIGLHAGLPSVAYIQEPNRALYEAGYMQVRPGLLPWVDGQGHSGGIGRLARVAVRERIAVAAHEEWRAAHAFDRVLVNSSYSRESFLRSYALDTSVCYLGVDSSLFAAPDRPREAFVVGLGSLHTIKGVDLAIRAVARMAEPRPALVWIGNSADESYLAEITRLASSLGVSFQPRRRIADAEVVDLLGRATAFVYTSRLEPFGFAPLEANACGTPVVAVAEAGVRETIVDGVNGYLVENRDPEALAAALQRVFADPAQARAMGRRGRALVEERWTVDRSVACVERHLIDVARSGRRAAGAAAASAARTAGADSRDTLGPP